MGTNLLSLERLVWIAPFLQVLFDVSACLGLVLSCVRPVYVAVPLAIMVSANTICRSGYSEFRSGDGGNSYLP